MNNCMRSSFLLASVLSAVTLAAPIAPPSSGQKPSTFTRDDANDHPYYFPVGGIIAIPLVVVALLVVTGGLLKRKFHKPSTTQEPPISLVERTRTNTLPPYQRDENNPGLSTDSNTSSVSSNGPVKPQDAPPAYAPPPNNSTAPPNTTATTDSAAHANSTGDRLPPGNGQAS